jgi:hypothetical protein
MSSCESDGDGEGETTSLHVTSLARSPRRGVLRPEVGDPVLERSAAESPVRRRGVVSMEFHGMG